MATSNSYDWTLTRSEVISGALRKLGVLASGTAPSTDQTNDAASALNALIKAFHADGMPVWAIVNTNFTVTNGTASYTIGPTLTISTAAAPLKVLQATRTLVGESAVPLNLIDRYDYNLLPNTASGIPVSLYYQPTISDGVGTGVIKLWPTPNDSTTVITLNYQRPFSDVDSANDNLDFPSYWMQALIYNLAWSLAPEYGTPPNDRTLIQKEAIYWKDQALSYGTEEGSIYLEPARQ